MSELLSFFDLTRTAFTQRIAQNGGWNELLVRALKINRHAPGLIIDFTAGLGRDMFLLATLGCSIIALERNPKIFEQLSLALEKAKEHPDLSEAAHRVQLINQCATTFTLASQQDVWAIYCDPMFPQRTKSAAVKKEALFLQEAVGEDKDSGLLLSAAVRFNPKRIVVKRPKAAPFLADYKPHHQIKSTRIRYDIYFPQNIAGETLSVIT